ncbi:MAG: hypothetical protein MJ108_08885 [Saccharofermentans sp.]|nr:hypothetical protein [Saccharofermentans sp.]
MSDVKPVLVYAYIQTSDTGFAPCYDDPFWTLACCKPQIRHSIGKRLDNEYKNADVYVVGLSSKDINGRRKLNYIARVNKAIPVSEYYSQYKGRKDSVYVYSDDVWMSNKRKNYHLNDGCSKKCKADAVDTDEYVCINDNKSCLKDLFYRGKENYVLISDKGDFVHYKCYCDEKVIQDIEKDFADAARFYRVYRKEGEDARGFGEYFMGNLNISEFK